MDLNYLYSLLALAVGVLAGFQGIYERYQRDSIAGTATLPGIIYLVTRGAIPASVFILLYTSQIIKDRLWLMALACGTGAEIVLRMKFYISEKQTEGGGFEELLRGPFDLLRWYQDRFLEWIADSLAESRKIFVNKHLPQRISFADLRQRVNTNCLALPDALRETADKIKNEIQRLSGEYTAAIGAGELTEVVERRTCLELGYIILKAGRKNFKTLLKP